MAQEKTQENAYETIIGKQRRTITQENSIGKNTLGENIVKTYRKHTYKIHRKNYGRYRGKYRETAYEQNIGKQHREHKYENNIEKQHRKTHRKPIQENA